MTFELHDLQAEEAALAAAVTNPAACAYLVEHCREEDFGRSDSRSVLHAVAKLQAAGRPVDPVTVCTAVGSGAEPEDAERLGDYVAHLSESFVVAANVAEYVTSIVGHSAKRRAILAGGAIREAAMSTNGSVADLPGRLEVITVEAVQEMRGRSGDDAAQRFHTAAEVAQDSQERPPAVVEDLLFAEHSHLLIGPPKESGKSTLCYSLAAAIAGGYPWAGRRTQQGAVVYVGEEGTHGMAYKVRKHGLAECQNVYLAGPSDLAGLDFGARVGVVCKLAADVGAVIVFIDTLSAVAGVRGDDENSAGAALELMAQVDRLKQAGLAVVCVQHQRKGGGNLAESARGSSAAAGGVDFLLSLEKPLGSGHDNRRILTIRGRVDVPPTLVIDLAEDGCFHYVGDVAAAVRNEARQAIVDLLTTTAEPLTEAELVDALKEADIGRTSTQDALRELLVAKTVDRGKGMGSASNKAFGYFLTEDES